MCQSHSLPYQQAWVVGWREGVLRAVIDEMKFHSRREAAVALAELVSQVLPSALGEVVLVPVPTTAKNVRLRGFDHTLLIAKRLAILRGWRVERLLARQNNITQHFTRSATERRRQAKTFFRPIKEADEGIHHLLIDDIYTTGSTIEAAARCLQEAGANSVSVATIAYQQRAESSRGDSHSRD